MHWPSLLSAYLSTCSGTRVAHPPTTFKGATSVSSCLMEWPLSTDVSTSQGLLESQGLPDGMRDHSLETTLEDGAPESNFLAMIMVHSCSSSNNSQITYWCTSVNSSWLWLLVLPFIQCLLRMEEGKWWNRRLLARQNLTTSTIFSETSLSVRSIRT